MDIEKELLKQIEKSKYYSQTEALVEMISGRNVYLSGPAGSGKSYLISKFVEYMTEYRPDLEIAITAPTGTASVNINGITIHSYTGMGVSKLDFKDRDGINYFAEKNLQKVDILIIDEIAMLSAWQLRFILDELKFYRRNDWQNIQVIVCGDFTQLPPVSNRTDPKEMSDLCYGQEAWKEFNFKNIYIDRVYRAEDETLKNLLDKISLGNATKEDLKDLTVIEETEGYAAPILVSTNRTAEKINNTNHENNISLDEKEFDLEIPEDKGDRYYNASLMFAKQSNMDKPVKVKTNDTVMITVNENNFSSYCKHLDKNSPRLQNGMIGKIIEIKDDEEIGLVFEYKDPDNNKYYRYLIKEKCNFEQTIIKTDEDGSKYEKVIASFSQVPIRLAYAISIHKSQGQTYTHVIADLSNCWMENLGYVALSRARSIKGLYLLENNGKIIGKKSLKVSDKSIEIKKEVFKDSYIGDNEKRLKLLKDKIDENKIIIEDIL